MPEPRGRQKISCAPFEQLLINLADLCSFAPGKVVAVGETSQADLEIRPDYSVTVHGALVGFVEFKTPGKGAHCCWRFNRNTWK